MKEMKSKSLAAALSVALFGLSPTYAEKYDVDNIGTTEGGSLSLGYDVNSLDQVVGTASFLREITVENPEDPEAEPVTQQVETFQGFYRLPGQPLQPIGVIEPNLGEPPEDTELVEQLSVLLNTQLFAINNNGLAAGYGDALFATPPLTEEGETIYNSRRNAITYDGTSISIVPLPEEATSSVATAINDSGVLVGYANRPFLFEIDEVPQTINSRRAWRYDASQPEPFSWLPFPSDPDNPVDPLTDFTSTVAGVDETGRAVGTANGFFPDAGFDRAFYADPGATELTELPLVAPDRFHSSGEKISNNRILVNEFNRFNTGSGIFTFQSRGIIHDLTADTQVDIGVINANEDHTVAKDINSSGQVVGFARVGERLNRDVYHAFYYDSDVGIIDLNTKIDCDIGWELLEARAISDDGVIVGTGFYTYDNEEGQSITERRAFRLTLNADLDATPNQSCVQPNPFQSSDEDSGGFIAPHSLVALILLGLLGRRRRLV